MPYALWRDPVILAIVGTLAVHLLAITAIDAVSVIGRPVDDEHQDFEVDFVEPEPVPPPLVPDPPEPPKPDDPKPDPVPVVQPKVAPQPQPHASVPHDAVKIDTPPPEDTPPSHSDPVGGAPVVQMDDIAPAAHGVPVARGTPHERVGRGRAGTGAGSGEGSGFAATPPVPVSVATIKKRAMPKGDYGYIGAKDYPEEARQLGVEGDIRVRLVVDATGAVTGAVLLNKLGHGLDERALAQVTKIAFEPAVDSDDKPVASVVVWTFHFTLPKG